MKQIQTALFFVLAYFPSSGIAQSSEISAMIGNENRYAVMLHMEMPEKEAREALRLRLERAGLKEKISGNLARYTDVIIPQISPDKIDLYTKVESAPNNTSIVYMSASRKYNNLPFNRYDSSLTTNVKAFLESLIDDASRRPVDIDHANQLKDIANEEKNYQQLLSEQTDLQKKRSTIDDRLLEIRNSLFLKAQLIEKKKIAMQNAKRNR